ncbi:MAG TPA: DUF5665 domain-containing protein [Candidatus Dormibacteraeota bacterium]|nr:DUF5665 domain-containing protein [Candidatus Dormibacteraeota bacterium]
MKSDLTRKSRPSAEDYEKLGRAIESTLVNDYINLLGNTRRQIWGAFVRGLLTGFGGVIGATVMIALLLYVLDLAGALPVIGQFFKDLVQTIQR